MPTRSIVVFGAGGRAGRHVVGEARRRGHRVTAALRADADITDPEAVARAVEAFREELDRGYLAMVSTGPGHAEQVRELPLDAETVILRLPISGG